MKFSYIRVSKDEQNYDLQADALKREDCERIFYEKLSGASKHKPEQERILEQLRRVQFKLSLRSHLIVDWFDLLAD